jgi:ferredoxin
MKYEIKFDRENCMGCGACTSCNNWELKDDGKVTPIKTELEEIGCNQEAVDICPIDIIKIIEK